MPLIGRPHMPGYGVPETNDDALPWSWAEERMAKCRNFVISSTRPDGRPHAMPVWGVWLRDRFVFSTAITSVKSVNLLANPYVAISCEFEERDSLTIEGTAAVTALEDLRGFTNAYAAKYTQRIEEGPVWAVTPTVAFAFIADDSFSTTATKWRWSLDA